MDGKEQRDYRDVYKAKCPKGHKAKFNARTSRVDCAKCKKIEKAKRLRRKKRKTKDISSLKVRTRSTRILKRLGA